MNNPMWTKVEEIVDQVLSLPKDERKTYIDNECQGDDRLKKEVTTLLDSITESKGWLDNPEAYREEFLEEITDEVDKLNTSHSLIGKEIGSYLIKKKLGEGGMGSVYLAERADGKFEHKVAIKIIRNEKASEENIRRFEQERTILAGLNHSGIAKLFDGGITADGFPYLVMEHVDGIPIDQFCRQHDSTVPKLINLFKQVLEAVRHAHENLIVHRDLKPGNILVTTSGKVKILDFGISKVLQDDQADNLQLTQTNARLLTPKYAAPEQILKRRITTATDIYALGIILYNLLSNNFPFDLDGLSQYEMEQIILESDPPNPSAKTSAPFKKQLKGDLDAIVLKAIRKEPQQRYRTANEFWDDLDNFQKGLPIRARDNSLKYRTEKFLKRNKQELVIALGAFLLIIGFAGFYTWRIAEERNQAQLEAERAEEITNFLVTILQMNNPSENSGEDITVSDALVRGIDYLDEQQMSSLNRATILGTIGSIQTNTGDLDQASATLERAMSFVTDSLTEQSDRTLSVGTEYAEWQTTVGNYEEAEQTYHLTDSLFHAKQLTQSIRYLELVLNYSDFLMETGEFKQALQVLSDSDQYFASSGNKDQHTLNLQADLYNNRGRAYKNLGQNEKALEDLNKALVIKEEIYDDNNPRIGRLYHNIGVVYGTMGKFSQAKEMAEKAYEIRTQTLGPDHQLVGSTLHLLGNLSLQLGDYEQAFNYNKESIRISKQEYGPNHFRHALAIREYAKTLTATGQAEEAIQQLEEATSIIVDTYGENHPYYGYMTNTYAAAYGKTENYEQAMKYGQETISIFDKTLGPNHPNLGKAYLSQGKYALKRGQFEQANSLLNSALKIFELHFDKNNSYLKEADSLLQKNKESH